MPHASLLDKALQQIKSHDFDEGLRLLTLLIQDNPTDESARGHRAWLHRSLGRYEDAIQDYHELLRLNPENTEAKALLAETLLLLGHAHDAIRTASEVLLKDGLNTLAAQVVLRGQNTIRKEDSRCETVQETLSAIGQHAINPMLTILENDVANFPASIHPAISRLIYWLIRCQRPVNILEIGTHIGYSSITMGQAVRDNGRGHVFSFDLFLDHKGYVSPIVGKSSDSLHVARSHVLHAELGDFVTLRRRTDAASLAALLPEKNRLFDLAFIDGDHRIRGCIADWNEIDAMLAPGGIVILHDTEPERCGWLGPRYLMEEINTKHATNYRVLDLPTSDQLGLGIIQKKEFKAIDWAPSLSRLIYEKLFHVLRRP